MNKPRIVLSLFLSTTLGFAESLEKITIIKTIDEDETILNYQVVEKSEDLAKTAKGDTLGDYLDTIPGVESASYGPAVGRPVIHGMEGYRVGILQGDMQLNDLSAMSQDHAVGLTPRAFKRLELIKGPSTLLYGTYSGGVVRALGEEHQRTLLPKGIGGEIYGGGGSNGAANHYGATLEASEHNVSAFIHHYHSQSDDYKAGNGEIVDFSDTDTTTTHFVLGYKATKNHLIKLYMDKMDKSYGIPNNTQEETAIEMEQKRYGAVLHTKRLFDIFYDIRTEVQYSDYRHFETEDGRYDGLFDQQQRSASTLFHFDLGEWLAESRLVWENNKLRVCHEHGGCKDFQTPSRTNAEDGASLFAYYEETGIPYSHGHPMPNTMYDQYTAAFTFKKVAELDEISLGTNLIYRDLSANPDNIQETWIMPSSIDPNYYDTDKKFSASLSLGWWKMWSENITTQSSLAYLERLPSSQELFWNGFHHATESYIIGNRDLDKERSINIDIDFLHQANGFETAVGGYYYHFFNYIYQAPLAASGEILLDPFHLSPVWEMREVGARIYGATLSERYSHRIGGHKLTYGAALELLRGELIDGGNIPRMAPFNTTFSISDTFHNVKADLRYKLVDKSRYDAVNESETKGYDWLSATITWEKTVSWGSMEIWLKGENLTDSMARNHLSFLKASAPLPGRQISIGGSLKF